MEARPGVSFRLRMGRESPPFRRFLTGAPVLTVESRGSGLRPGHIEAHDVWWEGPDAPPELSADEVVFLGKAWGCQGVFLETDDPVFAAGTGEQILVRARSLGLKASAGSSGYLCAGARNRLLELVDALSLTLWGLSGSVYRALCDAHVEPVLATLEALAGRSTPGVEVTIPLLPGTNDTEAEIGGLCGFLARTLGPRTPVSFLAGDPSLPDERLATAAAVAGAHGLSDVIALIRAVAT